MKHTNRIMILLILVASIVALATSCDLLFGKEYTLSFDANGGTGSMDPVVMKADQDITLPPNSFTRTNYTFAGWATTSGGSMVYANEASYTMGTSDTTLFAVWNITFAGGDGTSTTPYQVANADQFNIIRNYLDKYFVLIDAIDLSGYATGDGWEPIGTETEPFTGNVSGDGYTISNLFINRPSTNAVGLFGYTSQAIFAYIDFTGVDVTGNQFVGALVGTAKGTEIEEVYVQGSVTGYSSVGLLFGLADEQGSTGSSITSCTAQGTADGTSASSSYVGGLGGWLSSSSLTKSWSQAVVTGAGDIVGGLVGISQNSTISRCYATGNVSGSKNTVGGLVGDLGGDASNHIEDSYASGTVTGNSGVGGLLGNKSYDPFVRRCYAVGAVSGNVNLGGLIGNPIGSTSTVSDSYYDSDTTVRSDSGRGTGKTTAEMKQKATFTNWDFVSHIPIWEITENVTYPTLFLAQA